MAWLRDGCTNLKVDLITRRWLVYMYSYDALGISGMRGRVYGMVFRHVWHCDSDSDTNNIVFTNHIILLQFSSEAIR